MHSQEPSAASTGTPQLRPSIHRILAKKVFIFNGLFKVHHPRTCGGE